MVINNTEYLFHYTSIEKLALILKNRTIRLNSLSNMDDLQEGRAKDLKKIGRFYFVSSWTDEDKESIPMWNMYTKMESGVRIGLPKNPFVWQGTRINELREVFKSPIEGEEFVNTFLNIADLIRDRVYSIQAWGGDILTQVQYTDDIDLLEPKIVSTVGDTINLDMKNIGKYKNKYWDFQKEWRYMMTFLPFSITENVEKMQQQFFQIANRMAQDAQAAPFDYYDLNIREDAFDVMLITPSPKITTGNRIILETLIDRYNHKATINESELSGLL